MTDQVELFYAPQTRATGVRVLLEELGAPYKLNVLNFKLGENRQPAYLGNQSRRQGSGCQAR